MAATLLLERETLVGCLEGGLHQGADPSLRHQVATNRQTCLTRTHLPCCLPTRAILANPVAAPGKVKL